MRSQSEQNVLEELSYVLKQLPYIVDGMIAEGWETRLLRDPSTVGKPTTFFVSLDSSQQTTSIGSSPNTMLSVHLVLYDKYDQMLTNYSKSYSIQELKEIQTNLSVASKQSSPTSSRKVSMLRRIVLSFVKRSLLKVQSLLEC